MLKSIGAFVCVHSREVVRFWEGPLREAPLYTCISMQDKGGLRACSSKLGSV